MVGDPVERRGREDRVHRVDTDRLEEVADEERDAVPEAAESLARPVDHRGRAVERDDVSVGETLDERLRYPSRAAAGVRDGLVTAQVEAVEHRESPPELRIGDRS